MIIDGIDHGTCRIEDCLEAVIERYEDGYVYCPILWSDGKCEECMEIWESRQEVTLDEDLNRDNRGIQVS